jgi:peptidoglycan-associated lipoprotein
MVHRLRAALFGLVFYAFVSSAGCPAPATTKPQTSSAPTQAPQVAPREQSPPRTATREAPIPPSSLEALRRGEKPVTPASSPLKEIYFEFDRYDLNPQARATLKADSDWLKANPSARVEVEGHCDERGTNEYNLALGAKRAQAAKDYLVSLGIAAGRLSTISYGEEVPVCKEQSEDCWQKNRRARFVIIPARPAS